MKPDEVAVKTPPVDIMPAAGPAPSMCPPARLSDATDPEMPEDYEYWNWDYVMEMPPPVAQGVITVRGTYLGNNPPMQLIFPDEIPFGSDDD